MDNQDRQAIADEVLDVLTETVMKIGPLLDKAFESYATFDAFVTEHLPLHPHTAERIRSMWHLHQSRPDQPDLPAPWKALWAMD